MSSEPGFSAGDAAEAISRASAFTVPAQRRAEGVTILVWGLISTIILLLNVMFSDLYGFMHRGGWREAVAGWYWAPLALLGVMATIAVWRIAEVSAHVPAGRRRSWKFLVSAAVAMAGLTVLLLIGTPVAQAGFAVASVGLIWLVIGIFDLTHATPTGRRSILLVGTAIVLAGVIYGLMIGGNNDLGWRYFSRVATPVAGGVPTLVGLWQALRS